MSIKTLAHVGCELVVAMAGLENFSEIVHRRIQVFGFHFPLQCHMCQATVQPLVQQADRSKRTVAVYFTRLKTGIIALCVCTV